MTTGERLRAAIKETAGISVREFHRRMEGLGVAGSSYPNIHRYLSDDVEPSLTFLSKAAEILGVRYEWLATDEGARTKEEAKERAREDGRALEVLGVRRRFAQATAERVLGALGCEPGRWVGLPYWVPAASHLAGRLVRSYPKSTSNGLARAEEELGRALGALLVALGIEPRRLHPRDVDQYILSLLPVVVPLADYRRRLAMKTEED